MPVAVVLGGSVVGSVAGLLLARAGWQVTVVDPDADLVADAAEPEPCPGAPQRVQAHGFMSRTLHELTTRLPDVADALLEAGAPRVSLAELLPPHLHDGGRPGDEDLATLRVRRVTLDGVLARAVRAEPGVRRVLERADGLLVEDGDPPRVRGVRLRSGTEAADLVVDATGRRSPVARWLADLGTVVPERTDGATARYYTRHYRVSAGAPRLNRGFAEVHDFPSLTQLLFLGDRDTAMLAASVHDDDPVLKRLRHPSAFDVVAAANEDLAAWWAVLTPTSPVYALGAFHNRLRRPAVDGHPVARGLVQVGDALASTNPTRGRGIAMGLATAGVLVDALAEGTVDDAVLALDAWVERTLAVYYRESAAADAALARRLRAGLRGKAVPANAPAVELPAGHPVTTQDVDRAAGASPEVVRALLRAAMLLDDDRAIASPAVAAEVRRVLDSTSAAPPTLAETGGLHDRARLEALLAPYA